MTFDVFTLKKKSQPEFTGPKSVHGKVEKKFSQKLKIFLQN